MRKLSTNLAMAAAVCVALVLPAAAGAATPGNVTGKVTNASTGSPIEFLQVCAYKAATQEFGGCDSTSSSGEYLIENLAAGSYKVEFSGSGFFEGSGYFTQWYDGKASFEAATPVAVSEGGTTSGIDAAMQERGGKISGTVTDATTGSPIDGVQVCAGRVSIEGFFYFERCARSDGSGQYTISSLSTASYKVRFSSLYKWNETTRDYELDGPNYVTQFYNGKAHGEEGDQVGVTEGATASGINAAMQPGATVAGTVTDATTGTALEGITACAWGPVNFYCDQTNASGQYAIYELPGGPYKVEFDPDKYFIKYVPGQPEKEHWLRTDYSLMEYTRQYFNNKFTFAGAETLTAIAGGTITGIDAKMTKEIEPPLPAGTAKVGGKVKVKGGKALLKITCKGTGPCKGNVKLTAKVKAKGKKAKSVVIGKSSFGIEPGKTKTVGVKLSKQGKSLLESAGKKGLKVKISGTGLASGNVTLVGEGGPKKQKAKKGGAKSGGGKKGKGGTK